MNKVPSNFKSDSSAHNFNLMLSKIDNNQLLRIQREQQQQFHYLNNQIDNQQVDLMQLQNTASASQESLHYSGIQNDQQNHFKTETNNLMLTETVESNCGVGNNNMNNMNLFLQTQELSAENDYLKKQVSVLKQQIDERVFEQKQMMEETQTKDMELRELIEMVRQYEQQIRELQLKLEEQIQIHEQRENLKNSQQQREIQAQQEIQQVKLLFQEFILVKDDIEKQLEDIVKKVLDKDEINFQNQGLQEDQNSQRSKQHKNIFSAQSTLQKFQEGFSQRKIQDIMRNEIAEVKELLEVLKDLRNLINQMLQEKAQIKSQLDAELDLRGQIEKALENQELETLSPELLIMKIKILEHAINSIQSIFSSQNENTLTNSNNHNPAVNQQSTQYLIYQQLKLFSTDFLDEKVRLTERLKFLESHNSQLNEDLQALMSRVEECERENTDLRIQGEKRIEEEKRKLMDEVEEIRRREEKLELEIQQKLEEEIIRMQVEQEKELQDRFIDKLAEILSLKDQDRNSNMGTYEEAIKYASQKVKNMLDKIQVLTENKELLMKERNIFEERMTEFSYENQQATKQVDQLHSQLQDTTNGYKAELQNLKDELGQQNQNTSLLMTKFRQAASELHEVREEREKLKKEIIDLQEIINSYEKKNQMRNSGQGSLVSTNYFSQQGRPPIQSKNDNSLSPTQNMIQSYSARGNTAVPQPRKQPIQIYTHDFHNNSSLNEPHQPTYQYQQSTPKYQGSVVANTQQLKASLDEKQLSNLIKDYKNENLKFSQKVQELQKKIQSTAQLSPLKQDQYQNMPPSVANLNGTQTQRAASSKPLQQRNSNLTQSQQMNSHKNAKADLNKKYFSSIDQEDIQSARFQMNENHHHQLNSGRGATQQNQQRILSCSLKNK